MRGALSARIPQADIEGTLLLDGVTRRTALHRLALAWLAFAAATGAGLTATIRFLFPNVLFEPPTRFKAGDPSTYAMGVDERWKEKFGVWIVRNTAPSTRSWPSARISAAPQLARRRRTSSNVRATDPGITCRASTSRGPLPGPSSARRSAFPRRMARSSSTKPFDTSTNGASGAIRMRSSSWPDARARTTADSARARRN